MASQQTCRKCGRPLDGYSPEGECPRCMLAAGLVAVAPAALAEEAPMQLAPGGTQTSSEPFTIERFGDYELLEEIARGGMGIVYKAHQLSLDRIVAIKRLLFAQYSSQEFIHRFRIEASAAASLQHPNIVAIHEVGVHQGQHYFAMDYVEGRDLANVLRDGSLSANRAASYVKAMAQAIQFAHQRGILHRDLKPSNILIDSFDQPRITDFGLAKRLTNDSDLTLTGQVLGSPNYMPPEQASANRGQLGPHTDVYSLGAILYHALTGRPPFLAQSVPDTLQQVLHDEPIAPRLLNPSIPLDLATICLKCLEKEPGQRYASAQALADDLGRFLNDETILARPVSPAEKVCRWCRRKPVVASLAAAVSLLLVVVAVGSTVAALRVAAANREQQRENYYASIALADQYIREGSIARALEILFNCPSQFRHWEWGHLMYLCHQDVLSIQADTNDLFASRFGSDLHSLPFSPDSTRLATRSADGKVKVWELADGRSLFTFSEPTNPVLCVTFSPDGRQLALGTTNGRLKIFETLRWRELLTLSVASEPDNNRRDEGNSDQSQNPNPQLQITHLAYSPDGKNLAVATANRTVSVWNIALAKIIFMLPEHSSAITQLRFTPDGQRLISTENFKVSIWQAETGRELSPFEVLSDEYRAMFADPQANRFATIDGEGNVKLWSDARTGRNLGVIRGTQSLLYRRVFFSPDGRFLCTGGEYSTATVRDATTGEALFPIPTRVYEAAFSPDGQRLATIGAHITAKVWDVNTRQELLTLKGHSAIIRSVAFSPDGRLIATGSLDGMVKLWSADTGREVLRGGLWMWAPAWSPDGKRIALAPSARHLTLYDADSAERLSVFKSPNQDQVASAFSPDGRRIAIAGAERVARVFDVQTGREVLNLPGHSRSLLSIAFSPDGQQIATGNLDGTVTLWDAGSGRELHALQGDSNAVWNLSFNFDGRLLVSAAVSRTSAAAYVWETASGRLLFRLGGHAQGLNCAQFSPDGRRIFTSGADRTIRIWDARSGAQLQTWKSRAPATWLQFSHDGKRLVAVVQDFRSYGFAAPMCEIWDVEQGRELLTLQGHSDVFIHALFSPPDGRRLLTTSMDQTARQWETFPWGEADYPGPRTVPFPDRVKLYAKNYWHERLASESSASNRGLPVISDGISFGDGAFWPKRDPQAASNLIDLTEHYNGVLDSLIHPVNLVEDFDNDLSGLIPGLRAFGNVEFDVRGLVMLRRLEPLGGAWQRAWDKFQIRESGIRIERKFRRLHVLHSATKGAVPTAVKDGTTIGSYVLHYSDGSQREFEIIYGRELRDWWQRRNKSDGDTDRSKVVWTGSNPVAERNGATLRLFLSTYENPRSDVEVTAIDFVSNMTPAAPFLIAMTVEE